MEKKSSESVIKSPCHTTQPAHCVCVREVKVIINSCILYTHNFVHTPISHVLDVKQNLIGYPEKRVLCVPFDRWPITDVFISLDSWINWPSPVTCPAFIQHYVFTRGPLYKRTSRKLSARSCAWHIALCATESKTTVLQDFKVIVLSGDWWSFMSELKSTFIWRRKLYTSNTAEYPKFQSYFVLL